MIRKRLSITAFVFAMLLIPLVWSGTAQAQKPSKKARSLASQGDQLFNRRRYQEALQKYVEATRLSPIFPKARFFKGYTHFKLEQFSDAVAELDAAERQGYSKLDVASVRMEAYFANREYENSLRDATEAVRLSPKTSYYHLFLGRVKMANGDPGGASDDLARAIELGEKSADVYYYLAIAKGANGDMRGQAEGAAEALKRGTAHPGQTWYLLGDAQSRLKMYGEAAKSLTNAKNAFENDFSTGRAGDTEEDDYYNLVVALAEVYRNLNDFENAITTAKAGLSRKPNDGALHTSLAWYYSLSGRIPDAIAAGRKAVELAPGTYMAHTNLCRAYMDQGEYFYRIDKMADARNYFNQSISSCKRALQLEPEDGETNYYLGRAYFYMDNVALSNQHYRKSVPRLKGYTEENPNYSDGFYLLGNAYFATKQNDEAIDAYTKCLTISPRFARVRFNLGYVFMQVGKVDKAKEQYELLRNLDEDLAKKLLDVINKK
ncbi:MAG: tetratricopeptide repeat protein [Pyrinomonadaceae bacterium]